MSLTEYKKKRRFDRTPEPEAKSAPRGGRSFVIQKHAASHLHYDFRLELDGVLKSWAVPKGPSLDPSVKRLAMHVEDHPVAYGGFEGIIPKGEYGGGTVMLWDRGEWEPVDDAHESYRSGRLKFILHGEKLHGRWMLVRTGSKSSEPSRQWLLFKERDEYAQPEADGDVLEQLPLSVETGRSLDDIAADQDWVWSSSADADAQTKAHRRKTAARAKRRKARSTAPPLRMDKLSYDVQRKLFAGVRLTSPEKVLYPEQGITKLELATYYASIADWILPHLAHRPLVLVRCPEGRASECFYQKHPVRGTPESLRQIPIAEKTSTKNYVVVDDIDGLISLAQIGTLEIHAWGSREDRLEQPDRLIFDLDPDPSVPWPRVVDSARQVRGFLDELGLRSFLKTTGGKGLHLVVPVARRHDWDEVKEFCKNVAELIVRADPGRYTANMSKAARVNKIYLDYLRNGRGATAIAPYSTRARPDAPVSTPLDWDELSPRIRSDRFTVKNLAARLASLDHDPWDEIAKTRQSLTGPMKRVEELRAAR